MPLSTFHNLSAERQREIRAVSFREFENHGYDGASLVRIIETLQIARGSFYRYFEHKDALFEYLVTYAAEITDRVMISSFRKPGVSFYDAWIENFLELHRQEDGDMAYLRFISGISKERVGVLIRKKILKSPAERYAFMDGIVTRHQENGAIRRDLDNLFVVLFIRQMRDLLRDYLFYRYRGNGPDTHENWNALSELSKADLERELVSFTGFIRNSLAPASVQQ